MKRAQRHQKRIPNRREQARIQARYLEARHKAEMASVKVQPLLTTVNTVEDKPPRKRPTIGKLTRRQSKLLRRLYDGWVLRGLSLVKFVGQRTITGARMRADDVLALMKQGLLTATLALTETARILVTSARKAAADQQAKSALLRAAARL